MTDRELMQQALEALENNPDVQECDQYWHEHQQAITALRERLAQPEQCQCPECRITPHASDCAVHNAPAYPRGKCDCGAQPEQKSRAEKMRDAGYTRRPTLLEIAKEAQSVQEPVAWMYHDRDTGWITVRKEMRGFVDHTKTTETPLYAAPQPRQWQGLTEEEIGVAFRKAFPVGGVVFTTEAVNFYRAIEAKLREKNA